MDSNKPTSIFAQNFETERQNREIEKYGARLPIPEMAAHAHVYKRHSIPIPYGQFTEPTSPEMA